MHGRCRACACELVHAGCGCYSTLGRAPLRDALLSLNPRSWVSLSLPTLLCFMLFGSGYFSSLDTKIGYENQACFVSVAQRGRTYLRTDSLFPVIHQHQSLGSLGCLLFDSMVICGIYHYLFYRANLTGKYPLASPKCKNRLALLGLDKLVRIPKTEAESKRKKPLTIHKCLLSYHQRLYNFQLHYSTDPNFQKPKS